MQGLRENLWTANLTRSSRRIFFTFRFSPMFSYAPLWQTIYHENIGSTTVTAYTLFLSLWSIPILSVTPSVPPYSSLSLMFLSCTVHLPCSPFITCFISNSLPIVLTLLSVQLTCQYHLSAVYSVFIAPSDGDPMLYRIVKSGPRLTFLTVIY